MDATVLDPTKWRKGLLDLRKVVRSDKAPLESLSCCLPQEIGLETRPRVRVSPR